MNRERTNSYITEGVVVCLHSIEMLFSYLQNTKQTKVTLSTKQTRGKIIKNRLFRNKWAPLEMIPNGCVCVYVCKREWVWKRFCSSVCVSVGERKRLGGWEGNMSTKMWLITLLIMLTTSKQNNKRGKLKKKHSLTVDICGEGCVCMRIMVNELILLQLFKK